MFGQDSDNKWLTNHGGAPSQGCTGATIEVVNGNSAHERQLHMGMCINATCNVTQKRGNKLNSDGSSISVYSGGSRGGVQGVATPPKAQSHTYKMLY